LIEANLKPVMLLPYFIKAWLKQAKVWQQLTNVLAKVWLDGSTIGGFAKPNFSPGRTSNFQHQILTSTKQLNRQRLPADGILIPNLRQYSVVNCNQPVHQFISASEDRSEVANGCTTILLCACTATARQT